MARQDQSGVDAGHCRCLSALLDQARGGFWMTRFETGSSICFMSGTSGNGAASRAFGLSEKVWPQEFVGRDSQHASGPELLAKVDPDSPDVRHRMPLVSIIIPTYNRQRCLSRAIESILKQTVQDFEVIVVDDGSSDDTAAIVEEFTRRDFRIRSMCHRKNRGAQAARNTGARSANGNWLSFFDSDDWMLPTSIEARLTVARKQSVKVVHSDAFVLRPNQDRALFGVPPLNGSIYEALLRAPGPMFQAMIVSADAYHEMGGLDENVIAYQEWDTAIRLAKRHAFGFVPEPTFVYDCTGYDTISKSLMKNARGYEYILNKNFSEILLRLGPKAVSQHYEMIASHYFQSGARDLAMKSKWKSVFWWPNPRRIIRKFWSALGKYAL